MSNKRYKLILKEVDVNKTYEPKEAIKEILKTATAKFDETVELHIRLGVDTKQADQQVRGSVILPNGTGKKIKVLVIAKSDKVDIAKKAGADIAGSEEIIAKIASQNFLDFDVCITTPDMMGQLGRIAKILGPKGLMPSPKSGTVTTDIQKAVKDVKAGKVEYRVDKNAIIHCSIGKKSFGEKKIEENFNSLMDAIVKAKPSASKGTFIKSVTLACTMGPGLKVNYRYN